MEQEPLSGKKKAAIAAILTVIVAFALIIWWTRTWRVSAAELTAEDMSLLASDMPAQLRVQLASSAEARKQFAEDLKRLLAVAQAARAAGIDNRPEIKSSSRSCAPSSSRRSTNSSSARRGNRQRRSSRRRSSMLFGKNRDRMRASINSWRRRARWDSPCRST